MSDSLAFGMEAAMRQVVRKVTERVFPRNTDPQVIIYTEVKRLIQIANILDHSSPYKRRGLANGAGVNQPIGIKRFRRVLLDHTSILSDVVRAPIDHAHLLISD